MPASILGEVGDLLEAGEIRNLITPVDRPSCGSLHDPLLGDDGGTLHMRTACGHSWS
ncbi:hypothetical protein [Streptomyces minutiscleroticus]|uniref:Uncharacterized protein n=1 Tax=Streptomyces minutiscleroticus TaxID=68238 RepID=A0A918K600_9ACTN|nr:hypothetical protein [Streptomyces minutiscleroticus]GGX51203.1 hypothetical protein GCM10010358_00960 [Streptomyces minutiscleroticus]